MTNRRIDARANDQRRRANDDFAYAITNSPPCSFSNAMALSRAVMAHCAISSEGGWVVMRCSQRPGAVIRAKSEPRCLAAKRMISYETPAITGSNTIRDANRAQKV